MGVGAPSIRGGALRAIHDHNQETRYRIIIGLRIHESSGMYPPRPYISVINARRACARGLR